MRPSWVHTLFSCRLWFSLEYDKFTILVASKARYVCSCYFFFSFFFFFFLPKYRSLPVWLNSHANITVKNDKCLCLRIVYTWAFSFKNACISTRLGLQSTLIRWALPPKTHQFEIALESGSRKTHTYRISVDCRKHIKMKTIKVWQAGVFVACA